MENKDTDQLSINVTVDQNFPRGGGGGWGGGGQGIAVEMSGALTKVLPVGGKYLGFALYWQKGP